MEMESKRKILGSFIIGFALVAGAYTVANIGAPQTSQLAIVSQPSAPPRVALTVTDSDGNGIEDWRDSFVTTEPIIIEVDETEYTIPTTVTGRFSIAFFENIIRNRTSDQPNDEQVVASAAEELLRETSVSSYGIADISIINNYTNTDIRNYFNTIAGIIQTNGIEKTESELAILYEVTNRGKTERLSEIREIADSYQSILEATLATPVPALFAREHLDLINTYRAVQADISAMTQVNTDPALALMRIRRYEDNVLGLSYALQNQYTAMLPYASLFNNTDAALFLVTFNNNQQI